VQKTNDIEANIFCTYFEGGNGKELNKDYFNSKQNLFGHRAFKE